MIELHHVTKRFGERIAVDDLSLSVARGELCVLLGPSGCGKTTTMRMINRLVEPSSGRITIAGEDVSGRAPVQLRRSIGYVIQQIGLFPHLDIAANVGTVPQLLGWPKGRIRARVDELLSLVDLDPATFRHRYPHQLSGGQQQRVGVARALAADPPVLLMDEPFGALDPVTRANLQAQFRRLQQELGTTVVFVTHDLDEAVRLADRVAVLAEGGVLHQHAAPADVLGRPATPFVESFVGGDRGVKRLAVQTLQAHHVVPGPATAHHGDGRGTGSDRAGQQDADTDGYGTTVPRTEQYPTGEYPTGRYRTDGYPPDGPGRGPSPGGGGAAAGEGAAVPLGLALSDVLARLLLEPSGRLAVVDHHGRPLGTVDAAALLRAAQQDEPPRPPAIEEEPNAAR
jgi:osmoprotectant transport system ATP-binding protein